jgi:signal transduction histidine kinase
MSPSPSLPASILVIDDAPTNLHLLDKMLSRQGYTVHLARSGDLAFSTARATSPDLILLDIMMPDIDGYGVCVQLKADPMTQDIPVIFISALDEVLDKVKAFAVGGVDYVTKPFQAEEVLARVRSHLALRHLQKSLQEKNAQLEQEIHERRRTEEALQQQNRELDAFARTVAHDLKNPISLVTGYSSVLIEDIAELNSDDIVRILSKVRQSGKKMEHIIDALLLLAGLRKDEVQTEPLDMAEILAQVQQSLALMIEEYEGEIILPGEWPVVQGYPPWVEAVWVNYLSNGLKYGGRPPRLELGTAPDEQPGMIRFWVRDNGAGIEPDAAQTLFTEFTQLKQEWRNRGHGLGLSIVRRIIEKLDGQVGVESQAGGGGSLFYFTLPAVHK